MSLWICPEHGGPSGPRACCTKASRAIPLIECGDCDGCGWVEGGAALTTTCASCGGTGVIASAAPTEREPTDAQRLDLLEQLVRSQRSLSDANSVEIELDEDGDFILTATDYGDGQKHAGAVGKTLRIAIDRIKARGPTPPTEEPTMSDQTRSSVRAAVATPDDVREKGLRNIAESFRESQPHYTRWILDALAELSRLRASGKHAAALVVERDRLRDVLIEIESSTDLTSPARSLRLAARKALQDAIKTFHATVAPPAGAQPTETPDA